jgi:hypothetical protein
MLRIPAIVLGLLAASGIAVYSEKNKSKEPDRKPDTGRTEATPKTPKSVFDLNGDGMVTLAELEAAFQRLDRNGDGVLTEDELNEGRKSMPDVGRGETEGKSGGPKRNDLKREGGEREEIGRAHV